MLVLVFKSFQAATPRTNTQGLKGKNMLQLPRVRVNGKHSFKFLAPKLWNTLDDDLRITASMDRFRTVKQFNL